METFLCSVCNLLENANTPKLHQYSIKEKNKTPVKGKILDMNVNFPLTRLLRGTGTSKIITMVIYTYT